MSGSRLYKEQCEVAVKHVVNGIYQVKKDRKGFFEQYAEGKFLNEDDVVRALNQADKVAIFDANMVVTCSNFKIE